MCGIGGFYNVDGGSMPTTLINNLFCELEGRGTDAYGLAFNWVAGDRPIVLKGAGAASDNLKSTRYLTGKNIRYVLLHTRFTTQGSTKNNGNNHPVSRKGDDLVLTHNGVLRNDRQIFNQLNVKPQFDVDTEAINVALRSKGVKWMADNVKGSMSLAWVDSRNSSQEVKLFTNGGNPLVIGRTVDGNIVWASCEHYILDAGFILESSFNATPFKEYTLRPNGSIKSRWVSKQRKFANTSTYHSAQNSWRSFSWESVDSYEGVEPSKDARVVKSTKKANKSKVRVPTHTEMEISDEWAWSQSRGWFLIEEYERMWR